MQIKITAKDVGQRLDLWLATKFHDKSRAWLKKEIKAKHILVNKETKKQSYRLKEGDLLEIELKDPGPFLLEPNPNIKISVIYEDNDVLVINKPAGISVHPGNPPRNDTVANWFINYCPSARNVGDDSEFRPGIVHRLDKDTSGVMLLAKNKEAFDSLKNQFKEREVDKKYLALVFGKSKRKSGWIDFPIARSLKDPTKQVALGKRNAHQQKTKPRPAKTFYRVKEEFRNYSLIEVSPQTGRMHQIRVHLAAAGLPIVGDRKYGSGTLKNALGLKRQFLHAQSIGFVSLEGEKINVSAPLPPDLKKALEKIKASVSA